MSGLALHSHVRPAFGRVSNLSLVRLASAPTSNLVLWPSLKAALDEWSRRNILAPGDFALLREQLQSEAGLLANVWDQRFTAALYQSILDAITAGSTFDGWLPTAQKIVTEYGGATVLFAKADQWTPAYAELVFRMANASAMAAGRYAQMFSPERIVSDPYVLYSTMQDERVREEHAALDGMVFRKDDLTARALYPPSDYNCRCWLIEMDAVDFADGGHRVASGSDFPPPPEAFNRDRVAELVPGVLRRAA